MGNTEAAEHNQELMVKAEMLIRKPSDEVYEAFINPDMTTKFWFTKSSGRLELNHTIQWDWEMYGATDHVLVMALEENKRILVKSSDNTFIEWTFTAQPEHTTFVTIQHYGFNGNKDEVTNYAIDSMGGFTMVLCGLKAYLEHGICLNLVADKAPYAHINQSFKKG